MTRDDPSQTAPITLSGWYKPLQVNEAPSTSEKPIVTIYGMSHAVRLAEALARTSDRFSSRSVGAPGATTNWSYGAYLRDRGGGKSRAVVLALMSVSLPMITAMSPLTYNYDFAEPYTSDRFYLDRGQLRVVHPPFASFKEYIEAFDDPKEWAAARDAFARYDPWYNRFLFRTEYSRPFFFMPSNPPRLCAKSFPRPTQKCARCQGISSGKRASPGSK